MPALASSSNTLSAQTTAAVTLKVALKVEIDSCLLYLFRIRSARAGHTFPQVFREIGHDGAELCSLKSKKNTQIREFPCLVIHIPKCICEQRFVEGYITWRRTKKKLRLTDNFDTRYAGKRVRADSTRLQILQTGSKSYQMCECFGWSARGLSPEQNNTTFWEGFGVGGGVRAR